MLPQKSGIYCRNCGVEITWSPILQKSHGSPKVLHYCCQDCLDGLECRCGERMELEEQRVESSDLTGMW